MLYIPSQCWDVKDAFWLARPAWVLHIHWSLDSWHYHYSSAQGPVSRKPRKLFGPVKLFLVHLYITTEKCILLKLNSNSFSDDCTVCWYHDVGVNKYREVIMTHQTLSLEKYWKLFQATLKSFVIMRFKILPRLYRPEKFPGLSRNGPQVPNYLRDKIDFSRQSIFLLLWTRDMNEKNWGVLLPDFKAESRLLRMWLDEFLCDISYALNVRPLIPEPTRLSQGAARAKVKTRETSKGTKRVRRWRVCHDFFSQLPLCLCCSARVPSRRLRRSPLIIIMLDNTSYLFRNA